MHWSRRAFLQYVTIPNDWQILQAKENRSAIQALLSQLAGSTPILVQLRSALSKPFSDLDNQTVVAWDPEMDINVLMSGSTAKPGTTPLTFDSRSFSISANLPPNTFLEQFTTPFAVDLSEVAPEQVGKRLGELFLNP